MKVALRLAKKIASLYLVTGVAWILLSDWIVFTEAPWWFQTAKGLLYVIVTAVLLFWLVLRDGHKISDEEARYRAVFETSPGPIILADSALRIVDMNPAARRLYSATVGRAGCRLLTDLWAAEDRSNAAEQLRSAWVSGTRFEAKHGLDNGKSIAVMLTACSLDLKSGPMLLLCVQDLTDWREKESRIRMLNCTHSVLSSVNQVITRAQEASSMLGQCCQIAVSSGGFSLAWIGLEDGETNALRRVAHAGGSDRFLEVIAQCLDTPSAEECVLNKALRESLPVLCPITEEGQCSGTFQAEAWRSGIRALAVFPLKLEGQKCQGIFMLCASDPQAFNQEQMPLLGELARDIAFGLECRENERQKAEAQRALRDSEERFRLLVHSAPDAVLVLIEGRISYMNAAAFSLFGVSSEQQMIGRDMIEIIHPRSRDEAKKRIQAVQYDKKTVKLAEADYLKADGTSVRCEVSGVPFWFEGKVGEIVFVRDVSTRTSMQEQLRQAQREEVMRRLAGVVAHDFNNLLQVINGSAELACDALEIDHPSRPLIEQVRKAGKRASTLVERLLIISSRHIPSMENLDFNVFVNGAIRRVERMLDPRIQINCLLSRIDLNVKGDQSTLEQLFVNLCSNARDAMPDQGALTIATEEARLDDAFCGQHTWARPGHYAVLQVSDTGNGFPQEEIEHLFDPFFTTTNMKGGDGLRLALVNSIVTQHNGFIRVESATGRGTTFRVYLPTVQKQLEISVMDDMDVGAESGTETILLAEDDEMVRCLTSRFLRNAGYTVLEACNGQEAVEMFKTCATKVDGVILDVLMPIMGGFEAHDQIRGLSPETPVIFASAFSEQAFNTPLALINGGNLVKKPFERRLLLRVLRKSLDKASSGRSLSSVGR